MRRSFLRNNFDGTFLVAADLYRGEGLARGFAWADLDNDGAPDAVVIDARGRLHAFANERSGQFRPWPTALPEGSFHAMTIADADDDGVLDLLALRADGAILRISARNKRKSWDVAELGRWELPAKPEEGSIRLFTGDLDNNGAPDLIVSGPAARRGVAGFGRR